MKDEHSAIETYDALYRQLNSFWETKLPDDFMFHIESAIKRTKKGWDESTRQYYRSRGFSILNTSVYAVFLYYLAHSIGKSGGYCLRINYIISIK